MTGDLTEQSTFATPPPDPELQRLEPLLGRWRADDHTEDTILGRGVPVRSEESFSWLEGGYYLVQPYDTTFGDEPSQKGINYWYYDPEAKKFRIIFFSNNGNFSEDGSRYEGEIAGGKLTFEGPARFQYELDNEGMIKTNPDGAIRVEWWLRDESGAWAPWMHNTFARTR